MADTEFVFIGDPRMGGKDPTGSCEMYGIVFPAGVPVKVDDKAKAAKLRGHSHFAEVSDEVDAYDGMNIADLRAAAEAKGIDHAGKSKAELRDALRSVA